MPLLFSYGTLQQESVQRSTFGRLRHGQRDELPGYEPSIAGVHANVKFNGIEASRVTGTVFEVTDVELASADGYEAPFAYKRVTAVLASGRQSWLYLHES